MNRDRAHSSASRRCAPADTPRVSEHAPSRPSPTPAAELRILRLFEIHADTLILHDERGVIHQANTSAMTNLGYSREQLLSMRVFEIEVGPTPEELLHVWKHMPAGVVEDLTGTHRRADGSTFPVDVRVSCFFDVMTRSRMFLASARDVSAQRELEQRLQHSNDRLRELQERSEREHARAAKQIARRLHDSVGQELALSRLNSCWPNG